MSLPLGEAFVYAKSIVDDLSPFCLRIAIAGSIRREKPEVHDVEVVMIPNPAMSWQMSGFVLANYKILKGSIPAGKYMQIKIYEGFNADLFVARKSNWGLIYLIRTGSADFNKSLFVRLNEKGYTSMEGVLTRIELNCGSTEDEEIFIDTPEERDVFKYAELDFIEPKDREGGLKW